MPTPDDEGGMGQSSRHQTLIDCQKGFHHAEGSISHIARNLFKLPETNSTMEDYKSMIKTPHMVGAVRIYMDPESTDTSF